MNELIQSITQAMQFDAAALRVISQNIANAAVPAYRRQIALPAEGADFYQLLPTTSRVVDMRPTEAIVTDGTPGTLKSTGEPLHLAIEGEGYFVLRSSEATRLTRRGDFRISASGVLTAASGEQVLGLKGPIDLGTATPTVLSDGTVRVGETVLDQLQVVNAPDESLRYIGNAQYDSGDMQLTEVEQRSVRQGFLEAGNVTPVQEIVQMLETLRHFETAQRLLLGYDQLQQRAISELGRAES